MLFRPIMSGWDSKGPSAMVNIADHTFHAFKTKARADASKLMALQTQELENPGGKR